MPIKSTEQIAGELKKLHTHGVSDFLSDCESVLIDEEIFLQIVKQKVSENLISRICQKLLKYNLVLIHSRGGETEEGDEVPEINWVADIDYLHELEGTDGRETVPITTERLNIHNKTLEEILKRKINTRNSIIQLAQDLKNLHFYVINRMSDGFMEGASVTIEKNLFRQVVGQKIDNDLINDLRVNLLKHEIILKVKNDKIPEQYWLGDIEYLHGLDCEHTSTAFDEDYFKFHELNITLEDIINS